MRILYFSFAFPSINSRFIRDELDHFSEKYDAQYLHLHATDSDDHPVKGLKRIRLNVKENRFLKKLRWILWRNQVHCTFKVLGAGREIQRLVMPNSAQFLHCHFAYEGLFLWDNLHFDGQWIFHFHGYDASEMLQNRAYVKRLRSLSEQDNVHFIYCSDNIRQKLAEKGISNRNHSILYYGIDLDRFPMAGLPAGELFTFLHVSNLQEKKGIPYSLEGFASFLAVVDEPDRYRFVIVGGGGMALSQLKDLSKSLGIENQVEFKGQQSREEVIRHLESCHVFVHHSITSSKGDQEGIPNAIMEAMAMGVPVLTTVHSGIPELVDDGVHGYLSPECDAKDISLKMREIVEWPSFRIDQNRQRIEEKFNKVKHLAQLDQLYKDLVPG